MGKPDLLRTFICIELPAPVKDDLSRLQQALKRIDAKVSWVKPENIHLTLKFLGDVQKSDIPLISSCVERVAGSIPRFEIELSGTGCFPSVKNPRVFWVGLSRIPPELAELHQGIENGLNAEGFPLEKKEFSPHLTLGRAREPKSSSLVGQALVSARFESNSFMVTQVIVMRSVLSSSGSIYSPQAMLSLG